MKTEIKITELAEMLQEQILNGASQSDIIQIVEEYARIQIEKDREEVIENTPLIDRIKLIETYSNTPIKLD